MKFIKIFLFFFIFIYSKDHWWWDTETTNDGGVVFDLEVREFFNRNNARHPPAFPNRLEVASLNPATFWGRGGFRILQLAIPFRKGKLLVEHGTEVKFIMANMIIIINSIYL